MFGSLIWFPDIADIIGVGQDQPQRVGQHNLTKHRIGVNVAYQQFVEFNVAAPVDYITRRLLRDRLGQSGHCFVKVGIRLAAGPAVYEIEGRTNNDSHNQERPE